MYVQNDENCMVKSFWKYVPLLNPNCEAFLQHPKPQFNDTGIWYQNALSKNKIMQLMKTISKKAGLSKSYTNHCMCREHLQCGRPPKRDSVRAYVEKPTEEQRFNMSRYLHAPPPPSTSNAVSLAPAPILPLATAVCAMSSVGDSSSTSEAAAVPLSDHSTSPSSPSCSTSVTQCLLGNAQNFNHERLTHSPFSCVTFAPNSNPVYNINFGSH